MFVCTGREPQQKKASTTPGWTRSPIPTLTRTSTLGRPPLWTSRRRASRSRSPRARLPPPSWTWSGRTSCARVRVSWRRAVTPSPSASPPSPRGLRYSRSWSAERRFTGGERLNEFKLHGADAECQWACSFLVLIGLRATLYGCCMPASTAVMSASWAVCILIPLRVCVWIIHASLCWFMIARKECERNEDAGGKEREKTHKGFVAGLHCCLKSDRTELGSAWHCG